MKVFCLKQLNKPVHRKIVPVLPALNSNMNAPVMGCGDEFSTLNFRKTLKRARFIT
jgi:hypothetical protein